jgi:O-antigen/teichoic acid export membrane protein
MPDLPKTQTDRPTAARPPRQVVRNTLFSILTKGQSAVFTYLSTLLILRALSVPEYGMYSLLFSGIMMNSALIFEFGIPAVLMRFIPEYYLKTEFGMIYRLFRATNFLQAGLGAVLLTFILIFSGPISSLIHFPGSENVVRIFAVGMLAFLLSENFRMLAAGMFQHRIILQINFVYNVLRLGSLYVAVHTAPLFRTVVVAETIVFVLLLTAYWIAFRKMVRPLLPADGGASLKVPWNRFARYAGLYYLDDIGAMLLSTATDLFLITSFLSSAAVGIYGLANRILDIATRVLPSKILQDVIQPLFFSEYGAEQVQSARFGFNLLTKINILASQPVGIWLALMARPIIVRLFDARFADAAEILAVSAFFLPMLSVRFPLGLMLQNAERVDLLIYSKISGLMKIALGLWLVPTGGVVAMVWITGLSFVAQNVIIYGFIVWKLRVHADYAGTLRLFLNGGLSAAMFYPLIRFFDSVPGIVISGLVYMTIYLGLNMINRSFTAEERALINARLRRPLWRF